MSDTDIRRHQPGPRLAQIVEHRGVIYLAGQVAEDGSTAVRDQTTAILRQIDARLESVGSSRSRLLSATIYLRRISDAGEMNAAWDAWVDHDHLPARATVEAALVSPGIDVEICVIAAAGAG